MSLILLSDIHGAEVWLDRACKEAALLGHTAVFQLGDCGVWYRCWSALKTVARHANVPVYFLDGNHEVHAPGYIEDWWETQPNDVLEVSPNMFYVKRGSIIDLDGRRIACLGGAASIDYKSRKRGADWWPEEVITREQMERLRGKGPVDLMFTHTPPQEMISEVWNKYGWEMTARAYGLDPSWRDPSAAFVQEAWEFLGCPPLFAGHFHEFERYKNITVLAEGQTYVV